VATPPVVNAVRVRLDYTQLDGFQAGSRFYLSYAGSAPTAANLNTLGLDVASAWSTNLQPLVPDTFELTEVDLVDLGSPSGASSTVNPHDTGSRTGNVLTANTCVNVEYNIARRYRGGKPRMYLPAGVQADLATAGTWSSTFLGLVNTGMAAFQSALEALSIGSIGALQYVNISFYNGVSTTTPPWRGPGFKYPPKYRTTPLLDHVLGFSAKSVVGSQRRRRTSTSD
jgi:hypothetical protein